MEREFKKILIKWKEENINTPLMVVGARQIGKTYIIDKFCRGNFKDYIYINLISDENIVKIFNEQIDTKEKIIKMELLLNRKITEDTIIFFDEVQESEKLITALKYFCESDFPYKIICAGSLLGVKLRRFESSFPVGKVIIKYMYPMNFKEFLMAMEYHMVIPEIENCFKENKKMSEPLHKKLLDYYRLFLCIGGMPEAINEFIKNNKEILEFKNETITSIIDAYIADMKRYTLNYYEAIKIEKIYNNIPSQLAKENKKFQFAKIEENARRRDYASSIDWLVSSKLVIPCYFVNKFETPLKGFMNDEVFKLYLSDCGILTKMLEIQYNKIMLNDDYKYKGVITENYVVGELASKNISLYYWAENQVAEIDLLLDTKDGVIPIEIKSDDNTKSKSLNYYKEKNNPKFSYRISSKNFGFENNIKAVPLYAVFCINV
ncbi:MAG: AAA family ATPase [Clostridia bacterium]|nr:AAA family ATPase [Clostridia bacterium]